MSNYVTSTSDKKRKTAIILTCLGFLGIGGLQHFYVGRWGKGFLYLLTLGLCGIGTLIDLIKLLFGTFTDNVGVPLRE